MPLWLLREFLRLEAAAGFLLLGAAALALILANTPLAWLYHDLLDIPVRPGRRTQDQQAAAALDQRRRVGSGSFAQVLAPRHHWYHRGEGRRATASVAPRPPPHGCQPGIG